MKILDLQIEFPKNQIRFKTEDKEFYIDTRKDSSTKGQLFEGYGESKKSLNFTQDQENELLDAVKNYDIELYPLVKNKLKKNK